MQSSFQSKISPLEQKALKEICKLSNILITENYTVDNPTRKQYNYEMNISSGKDKVKLLVYFGKKGIKRILQGNSSSEFFRKIDSLLNNKLNFSEEEIVEPEEYIGSDESGKGDFFGPLIIAAFAIDAQTRHKLNDLNIRDSKEITDKEIKKIASELSKSFKERIAVVEIHPEKYNELYQSFSNLNKMLIWGHSKAIETLYKKFNYQNIIIDKFCSEDLLSAQLDKNLKSYNLLLTEKAERFKGVAVASIIARERLLRWFEKKSKELQIELPFGAGEIVNNVASHIKEKYGNEILNRLIKLHFKNFSKI